MPKRFALLFLLTCAAGFCQPSEQKAQQLFANRNFPEAKKEFLLLHRSRPSNPFFAERLGDLCSYAGNWAQAVAYYERVVQLQPESAAAHYKFGGALSMQASHSGKLRALGMIGDIRSSFEKAIALDPGHVEARWALVEYYLRVPGIFGGSESKANRYADELLKLSPVDHYLAKGRIEEYFDRYANAERYYVKADGIGKSETTREKLKSIREKMR